MMFKVNKNTFAFITSIVLITGIITLFVPVQEAFATVISDCNGDSSFDGEILSLNASIINFSGSNCLEISHSNVTLDCAGFMIDGIDQAGSSGIFVTGNDITIQRCAITNFDIGIAANYTQSSLFTKNTLNANNFGILLAGASEHNLVISNRGENNTIAAFSAENIADKNKIAKNNFSGNPGAAGIQIFTDKNKIFGNNVNNNKFGILLDNDADSNSIKKNRANQNKIDGISFCADCDFNMVKNNITRENGEYGIDDDSGILIPTNFYMLNYCDGNGSGGSDPTGLCAPQP